RTLVSLVDFTPQDNAEGRAVAGAGLILEHAAVLFNDASGNRQAKASAGFLRGEERVEQTLLGFGRNAFAGVAYFKNHGVSLAPAERGAFGARAQRDSPCAVNGFSRVVNEVD